VGNKSLTALGNTNPLSRKTNIVYAEQRSLDIDTHLPVVVQFELFDGASSRAEPHFRRSERSCAGYGMAARQIPRPAGENAGLRDDAGDREFKLTHYASA
jgi:hypothetical protein